MSLGDGIGWGVAVVVSVGAGDESVAVGEAADVAVTLAAGLASSPVAGVKVGMAVGIEVCDAGGAGVSEAKIKSQDTITMIEVINKVAATPAAAMIIHC